MTRSNGLAAFAAALLALSMWSGTAIANKLAVAHMSGLTAGVLRSLLAAMLALGLALALRLPRPTTSADRMLLLASGWASFAIWPALLSIGIERTTASHAAIIMATTPIFTVLIAHLADRRLPRPHWWLGATVAFVATVLLVARREEAPSVAATASARGDLTVLAGCLVCAVGYVAGGRLSRRIGSLATTFWGLASALLILLPAFAATAGGTQWSTLPLTPWLAIAWMALLSSLIGYGLWFFALDRGGIAKIGSLQLALPVATIIAAVLILDETISAGILAATAAIVLGTWWAHRYAS